MRWGLHNVRLARGGAIALAGVTVPADPGRITVIVGGDGAGKTSCLRVLAGLTEPDAGAVCRPARDRIGYVPATVGLYADLTVAENLEFTARAYRIPRAELPRKTSELLELTGLASARARLVKRVKPYAASPNSGPHTTDHTISCAVSVNCGTWYWCSLPRPIHATTAAIAEVARAGTTTAQSNVQSRTSSTNTAPPSGTL